MRNQKTAYDKLLAAVETYSEERDSEIAKAMFDAGHWTLSLPAYWGPEKDGYDKGKGYSVALTIAVDDTLNECYPYVTTLGDMLKHYMEEESNSPEWLEQVAKEMRELADDLDKAAAVQREKWG